MKKKITFIYPQMVMGGAEKVMIRLIENIDKTKYDVNVVLMKRGGELEASLSEKVQVQYSQTISLRENFQKGKIVEFVKGVYYRFKIRKAPTYEEKSYYTYLVQKLPNTISMDCVICFSHFNYLSICAAAYSNAKKKILWVHLGFRENMDRDMYIKALRNFDKVCCVSEAMKSEFDRLFPMYSEKSMVIYNLINPEEIRNCANEKITDDLKHISLLTVARLSSEKGQWMIPEITRKLLNQGYDIFWYLVGDGPMREKVLQEIHNYSVKEHVFLLGMKNNPYPYMKMCDIYVQTTSMEGYCTTTNEARVLGKPVVATDIPSIREQFRDGEGILVEYSVDGFCNGIKKLLDDKQLAKKIQTQLSKLKIDNEMELNKLYTIVD